jgi:hypothetical protein
MAWRLDHVRLDVGEGDAERRAGFYVDLLGFGVRDKPLSDVASPR